MVSGAESSIQTLGASVPSFVTSGLSAEQSISQTYQQVVAQGDADILADQNSL